MRKKNNRFTSTFKTRAGVKVRVEIDHSGNSENYIVRAKEKSPLTIGDVISDGGRSFLLTGEQNHPGGMDYAALPITHIVPLVRKTETTDLVTGLPRGSLNQTLDPSLPVHVKSQGTINNLGFEAERLQVLSGSELRPGDHLGPWQVQTVQNMLGVFLAEMV